ncbi:diaminopimelate epimerase [Paenibacillus xanthanilyticus]|uniref:Diaminopimelate epimerase n=1 Tax=Paenibacillus xanthanilyticus TaxID=1783531 RepID=A0ABV8K224_9BACL
MKQEIEFIKFSPTQNMTVLVKTDHPAEQLPHIASKVMSYDSVYAEQVGFIGQAARMEADARLMMAGGEFCGNACMALAVYQAAERGLGPDDTAYVRLEASGTEQLVSCQVTRRPDAYLCRVDMPAPKQIERRTIRFDGSELDIAIVRYPAFIHLVLELERFHDEAREKAEALAKLLGVATGAPLIGIMLFNPTDYEMAPLIYVPHLESLVWERGCGSGTASVGAYLAWKRQRDIDVGIRQPGGVIRVCAAHHPDSPGSVAIEGSVHIVAQGKAYIDI